MDLETINISGIKINLKVALKRLKNDLTDDWFPDFLDFNDFFSNNKLILDKLDQYINNDTMYHPQQALHIDIPKPGFSIRYSSETTFIDRLMYQACVDVIAEKFDSIHSNRIYSHRLNSNWKNEKYFFRYAVEEWRKFLNDAYLELFEKDENEVLLITDLTNYYESISIKDLYNSLKFHLPDLDLSNEEKKKFSRAIEILKELLSTWCQPDTQRGIPQNRDASSFLSNIFLNSVDNEMLKYGYNYFRYMDDIRIVCKDKFEARKALKQLVNELRRKGLNVNSKKTQILDLNNEDDQKEARDLLQQEDKKINQIENLLKSKKARGVQIAVPILREKTISLIESGGTLDRKFRFCINRLSRLNRIPELRKKLELDEITTSLLDELVNQPWSTDVFARYLISADLTTKHFEKIKTLLQSENKNIYEWQEFHLWRILASHKYNNNELIVKSRKNITEKLNIPPIIAGSILYLCSIGDNRDKKYVANEFKNLKNFFVQRAALVGIKSLDYSTVIKPLVESHIVGSLKGCYKKLKDDYKDQFIMIPKKLNYKDFYDELPDFIS